MKNSHSGLGVLLLVMGSIMLLNNTNVLTFDVELFWPLFMIVPGIGFHFSYFSGRNKTNASVLMPGAILTIYGLYFLFSILTGWQFSDLLWPIFPLGIGVGFYELYAFGSGRKQHLNTAILLVSLSLFAFVITVFSLNFNYMFPVILIGAGLMVVYQSSIKK
jgi:hypothetical protein